MCICSINILSCTSHTCSKCMHSTRMHVFICAQMYMHVHTFIYLRTYVDICRCVYYISISCKLILSILLICIYVLSSCMHVYIGGRKGGAMKLQPHLILRVLYRILIFTIEIFYFSKLHNPTGFYHLPPPLHVYACMYGCTYVHTYACM